VHDDDFVILPADLAEEIMPSKFAHTYFTAFKTVPDVALNASKVDGAPLATMVYMYIYVHVETYSYIYVYIHIVMLFYQKKSWRCWYLAMMMCKMFINNRKS